MNKKAQSDLDILLIVLVFIVIIGFMLIYFLGGPCEKYLLIPAIILAIVAGILGLAFTSNIEVAGFTFTVPAFICLLVIYFLAHKIGLCSAIG